ncbi:MAG: FHA domain-containing protein, partial [Planctomycetota bacterium]
MHSPKGFLELADGRQVEIANGLTIGRVAGCGLVLDDKKVSRQHARVIVERGVVEIEDLDSSNGVW